MPAQNATSVSPDTHLVLRFASRPSIGAAGEIRIYDAADQRLVDRIDLALAPGPLVHPGSGEAATWTPRPIVADREAPRDTIGGFQEGFRFHPVIVRDNTVTIYPRHGLLEYGHRYYVEIDPDVINAGSFDGIKGTTGWTFTTRPSPPPVLSRLVVAANGSGDFTTIQGAIDAVPDNSDTPITIAIRPGLYEEIVYFRHKRHVTFVGDDRSRTIVGYANNETLNGPPPGVRTSEVPGTFPYRRAAFMADASSDVHLVNLTLVNFTPVGGGQAEALILAGGRHIVSHVSASSHQDTVQFNDSVYVVDSEIEGDTDFLWGRGPAFFERTTLRQRSNSPFMWVRSTAESHGFVFVDCTFETTDANGPGPVLARNTSAYPDSEIVLLDSRLGRINPSAWSLPEDTLRINYWEFNSRGIDDGLPVDVRGRHRASRQLDSTRDAATIADYRTPSYVLGGWMPAMPPVILTPPAPVTTATGRSIILRVAAASVPAARYEWRRGGIRLTDGDRVRGSSTATLQLLRVRPSDAGGYSVAVVNSAGAATTNAVSVTIN
jgi:pectinesterase